MTPPLVAGVDAGGTSWKAVLARGPDAVVARFATPTAHPDETIGAVRAWLAEQRALGHRVEAVGLASFGPVDRDPASPRFGEILDTPKPGWAGTNARVALAEALGVPCTLDTDVNGALLAEQAWGAAQGCADAVYVTVGAGVGGGVACAGALAGRPHHPELGHVRLWRDAEDLAQFAGSCPRHGDCVEGLVSGSALKARWGAEPHELSDDHPAWPLAAATLARLAAAITYMLAPQRIVFGGGVMTREGLIERVRAAFEAETNGYGLRPDAQRPDTYLTRPGLGDDAGALGGVLLAHAMLSGS